MKAKRNVVFLSIAVTFFLFTNMLLLSGCGTPAPAPEPEEPGTEVVLENEVEYIGDYPNQQVTIIVPFDPGGATDLTGRNFANVAQKYLPVNVQVVSMPGEGGVEGTRYVYNSDRDGYTLLYTAQQALLGAPLIRDVGYSGVEDFQGIAGMGAPTSTFVVDIDSPWETLADFQAAANENPGILTYTAPGVGSANHYGGAGLINALGIDVIFVPDDGSSTAILAVTGGHIDAAYISSTAALTAIESGLIKPLMVSGDERIPELPDTPTALEQDVDHVWYLTRGVWAPKGVPQSIIDYWIDIAEQVAADAEFMDMAINLGEPSTFLPGDLLDQRSLDYVEVMTPIAEMISN